MHFRPMLGFVVGASLAVGCSSTCKSHCGDGGNDAGGICIGCRTAQGVCVVGTTQSNCGTGGASCVSCSNGQTCQVLSNGLGGVCGSGVVGNPCTSTNDCSALGQNSICKQDTSPGGAPYPGGYCSQQPCTDPSCPSDSACASLSTYGESQALCLKKCNGMMDCRADAGYGCYPAQGQSFGVCWLFPLPGSDAGAGDSGCPSAWTDARALCTARDSCPSVGAQCSYPDAGDCGDAGCATALLECSVIDAGTSQWVCAQ